MLKRKTNEAKNIRENETSYSKALKSYCSCPNNLKNDQSKGYNKFCSKRNSLGKTLEESEKFLRDELQRYGLTTKPKKTSDTKHFNSPTHAGRVDVNLKSVPEDRITKVNRKEILCRNKYKSKTEPNLSTDRYAEDLKKEIKLKKREIPTLPEKYKKKYLRSLKEELYLNKLTTHHDRNQQIEDIKKEIETYRTHNSPFVADNSGSPINNARPNELNIVIHHKDDKIKGGSERRKRKMGKEEKSDSGYGLDG